MKKATLIVRSHMGEELFCGNITQLPLREDLILAKSIEFYNDDAPCFIHRSAVMHRLLVELTTYLDETQVSGQATWEFADLPAHIQEIVGIQPQVASLSYNAKL